MRYDISKRKAPEMPNLGKGTECIKLLLSQASKDMYEPLVPMFFPVLGAHISGAEFQYPDLTWKEMCGQMAHLVADSGNNKGQLGNLVEAICRDFRQHDEEEMKKLVEWSRLSKTRGANKEKPARPDTAILFPPTDTTRAGFLLNAMGCETLGGRTQYFNLPEVEMANGLCGGHKQVSHMLRNIYDRAKAGAMRATADGVTGNPILRVCMTISSTPVAARGFYKNELFNGTFGRMVFSDMLKGGDDSIQEASKAGPKNMLNSLPNTFNEAQLEALRLESGKSKEGTKNQLKQWVFRKFITYSNQTGLYTKTEEYLGVKN